VDTSINSFPLKALICDRSNPCGLYSDNIVHVRLAKPGLTLGSRSESDGVVAFNAGTSGILLWRSWTHRAIEEAVCQRAGVKTVADQRLGSLALRAVARAVTVRIEDRFRVLFEGTGKRV
jgi:hypothetical protein